MKDALNALERFRAAGDPAVLATVVATRGSTYRKPGAHMVLAASGAVSGSVSGGCLEGDLLEIARQEVLPTGRERLVLYDTSAAEELVWGLNMGCNGVVEVLLTPAQAYDQLLAGLTAELDAGRSCALATVLEAGRRCLVRADGELVDSLGDLDALVRQDALRLMGRRACAALTYGAQGGGRTSAPGEQPEEGAVRVFIETVQPPPKLFLFGAGHDAIPLVEAAARVGWAVTVVDHRPAFLTKERFPRAERLVRAHADQAAEVSGVSADDFCVVMTHNYGNDQVLLRALCELCPRHIGMLGPRARTESLLKDLRTEGYLPPEEALAVLASPLGLDIGGEGPEEIAISAVAELQAVRHGRQAGRLRERQGPIHRPALT